jgi:hypothetical protein
VRSRLEGCRRRGSPVDRGSQTAGPGRMGCRLLLDCRLGYDDGCGRLLRSSGRGCRLIWPGLPAAVRLQGSVPGRASRGRTRPGRRAVGEQITAEQACRRPRLLVRRERVVRWLAIHRPRGNVTCVDSMAFAASRPGGSNCLRSASLLRHKNSRERSAG